ncbi:hypothetical protein LXL04_027320 [Taraxacum kok-saghyz]
MVVEDFRDAEKIHPKFLQNSGEQANNDEDDKLIDSEQSLCDKNSDFDFDGDNHDYDDEDDLAGYDSHIHVGDDGALPERSGTPERTEAGVNGHDDRASFPVHVAPEESVSHAIRRRIAFDASSQ